MLVHSLLLLSMMFLIAACSSKTNESVETDNIVTDAEEADSEKKDTNKDEDPNKGLFKVGIEDQLE